MVQWAQHRNLAQPCWHCGNDFIDEFEAPAADRDELERQRDIVFADHMDELFAAPARAVTGFPSSGFAANGRMERS